ncbi:DER1-domain-containing protein [Cyathus striatus]|nr:DER1-domain-containing protein [Cyathus striatus]
MDLIEEIKKIPPITRLFCGSLVGISLPVFAGAISAYKTVFVWKYVWKNYEIWRLYSSFFLGSQGFTFIFEVATLYQTTNQLETGPYKSRTADFIWQSFFAAAGIIAVTRPLQAVVMTKSFIACLVYLSSALSPPGAQTSVMGLFMLPIKYWPYVMIAMDLILAGRGAAMFTVAGCIVGHLWWWGVWGGSTGSEGRFAVAGRAPQWVRSLVGEANQPPPVHQPQGGAAAALRQAGIEVVAPRRASSTTTGYQWGSGRRLGGT